MDGITKHLEKLQAIADAHEGTRAAGFPGFNNSAGYVAQVLERAGWNVEAQPFDFDFFFQDAPTVFEQLSPDPQTYKEDTTTRRWSSPARATCGGTWSRST